MIKEKIYSYFRDKENKHYDFSTKGTEINFAPSYFSDCKRKIFYKKSNVEASNPITEQSRIKMEMGKSVHDKLQQIFRDMNMLIEAEDYKTIEYQGLKIIYRIDGKLRISEDEIVICEIKTVYASGFNSIEKEPKLQDLTQLVLYMEFEKVDTGILLYIGRDNGYMVEYLITNESRQYHEIKEKIDAKVKELVELKIKIENKDIPDRDFRIVLKNNDGVLSDKFQKDTVKYKSDWHCGYCMWKDLCWGNEMKIMIEQNNKFYIAGEFIK